MSRPLLASFAILATLAAASGAVAVETHVLRTGQSGGGPGVCGNADDSFTYVSNTACGTALAASPFQPIDFNAAATGLPAHVITPIAQWGQSLPCDPEARWINSSETACWGDPQSALYACPFVVAEPCQSTATVEVCWMVDDALGDSLYGGANPIGVYLNGTPLNALFVNGSYATETTASQSGVPVNPGLNYLYVYQRDAGCAISGLILSATISIEPCAVGTEPGTWGRVKSLYR